MLDKHVVEAELLCFFVNVARRLMATIADIVSVCPQESGQSLSHPEWKLEGKLLLFFFFFSSTPKWPPTCWLSGKEDVCVRTCVFVWTSACAWVSAHLFVFAHGCIHALVSVLRIFASLSVYVYILSHPDQEALRRGGFWAEGWQKQIRFPHFSSLCVCMFVSIT